MTGRLLIRLQQTHWPQVEWALADASGVITQGPRYNTLAEIPRPQHQEVITVLVPGAEVLMMQLKLPHSTKTQLRKAVPFALEEQLIADIETQHFALGSSNADDSVTVGIVAKQFMRDWLTVLQEAGLQAELMIPDYLAIPFEKNAWTIVFEKQCALIRTAKEAGCTVAAEYVTLVLRSLLAKAKNVLPEQWIIKSDTEFSPSVLPELGIPVRQEKANENFLVAAAKELCQPVAFNLLQGEFHTEHKYLELKRQWRLAAILGIAWIAILFLGHATAYFYLKNQHNKLQTQLDTLYRQLLPGITVSQDSSGEVAQELEKFKIIDTAPGFINLLAKAGATLHEMPVVHLTAISYEKPKLTLQVKTAPKDLTQLVHNLNAQSLRAKADTTHLPETGVKVHVTATGATR